MLHGSVSVVLGNGGAWHGGVETEGWRAGGAKAGGVPLPNTRPDSGHATASACCFSRAQRRCRALEGWWLDRSREAGWRLDAEGAPPNNCRAQAIGTHQCRAERPESVAIYPGREARKTLWLSWLICRAVRGGEWENFKNGNRNVWWCAHIAR